MKNYLIQFIGVLIMLQLVACGSDDRANSISPTTQIDPPSNQTTTPPTADAGADLIVNEGDFVILAGSGTDSEGSVTFQWFQLSGMATSLSDNTVPNPNFIAPQVEKNEIIELQLTVTDSDNFNTSDTIVITINNIIETNSPPTANAGPDQTVTATSTVHLSGIASDFEGDVTVTWTQNSGEVVTLSDTTITNPSFTLPNGLTNDVLIFDFTVLDSEGSSSSDSVSISIMPLVTSQLIPQGNWRVSWERLDYDNNGIFEGVKEYQYDSNGRLIEISYTYTDDGTVDFQYFSPFFVGDDTINGIETLEYDSQNRITQYHAVQEETDTLFTYEYSEVMNISRFTSSIEGTFISMFFEIEPVYDGHLIVSYSSNDNSSSPFSLQQSYEYDDLGRVISTVDGQNIRYQHAWTETGKLSSWQRMDEVNGIVEEERYSYTNDLLTSKNINLSDEVVMESYVYDSNGLPTRTNYEYYSSGQVDVVTETEWENIPCYVSHLWAPSSVPEANISRQQLPEGTEPGTGWGWGGCINTDYNLNNPPVSGDINLAQACHATGIVGSHPLVTNDVYVFYLNQAQGGSQEEIARGEVVNFTGVVEADNTFSFLSWFEVEFQDPVNDMTSRGLMWNEHVYLDEKTCDFGEHFVVNQITGATLLNTNPTLTGSAECTLLAGSSVTLLGEMTTGEADTVWHKAEIPDDFVHCANKVGWINGEVLQEKQ